MNPEVPKNAPLLLVAEDHPVNRALIERMLGWLGYRTVMVENGREAVDAARAQTFDAILLDLEMPVMGGLDAATEIRTLPGMTKLPMVALTAHAAGDAEHISRRYSFDGYVTKPIDMKDLDSTLRHALAPE
jgi:CheY-like chemotaxis protein